MKMEMAQLQQSAVHNHTAAMLEVLNQTSRLEIQLLENSLSTNKLEKQLMVQTNEISKLHDKNSLLEQKMSEMEMRHREELETLKQEKGSLQTLVGRQSGVIRELEAQLSRATGNSTALQRQQQEMMDTVHNLLNLCSKDGVVPNSTKLWMKRKKFRRLCLISPVGFHKNASSTTSRSIFRRLRKGFWEVRRVTGWGTMLPVDQPETVRLSVCGTDRLGDGHQAFTIPRAWSIAFDFSLQLQTSGMLFLQSHSGTAGRQSSLVIHGADFSTKDMDNDNCLCKCALMLTGGWWFDACGPSNLNGMYFTQGQHIGKLNGIKWHYFKGPSYSLRATAMMIRPLDFS
ncbi:angiopoietin-1 isoform X2 [Lates japonicus]|uniref:Angiopoietin-1 isoform X2 n=1 Tax=Lates japonicus TaxID=270547 RepID=A0AAD3RGU0_LATJO|nr:angiopoietin-1 isoform X2 [Lates japonicus]